MSIIKIRRAAGFSLTEMLIATGIMAIGLVMVATVFPVGVKLTSLTTERTVGSIVADEAFAKVKLYGLRDFALWPEALIDAGSGSPLPDSAEATYFAQSDFLYTLNGVVDPGTDNDWGTDDDEFYWPGLAAADMLFLNEFRYPSTEMPAGEKYRYHWSALCRRVGLKDVQVTVFVTRKALGNLPYYTYSFDYGATGYLTQSQAVWPTPVKVQMIFVDAKTLRINTGGSIWGATAKDFFDEGYTIVDDSTGTINRVIEMKDVYPAGAPDGQNEVILWEDWHDSTAALNQPITVWVVPPGVGSKRYPCIGVYQKIIRFDDIN